MKLLSAADSLPKIKVSTKKASDLIMMAIGAFSPLEGFMRKADYDGVKSGNYKNIHSHPIGPQI